MGPADVDGSDGTRVDPAFAESPQPSRRDPLSRHMPRGNDTRFGWTRHRHSVRDVRSALVSPSRSGRLSERPQHSGRAIPGPAFHAIGGAAPGTGSAGPRRPVAESGRAQFAANGTGNSRRVAEVPSGPVQPGPHNHAADGE